eukprot:4933126-Pleurochrysis_carterae.AAC.1
MEERVMLAMGMVVGPWSRSDELHSSAKSTQLPEGLALGRHLVAWSVLDEESAGMRVVNETRVVMAE